MNVKSVIQNKYDSSFSELFYSMKLQIIQHIDVLLFFALVVTKVMHYGNEISQEYFSAESLRPPVIASILPFLAISLLLKEKKRTNFLYVLNIIISFILFADTVYFRYFKDIISVGAVRNSLQLKGMGSTITSLIQEKDFLYLADVIVLAPLIRGFNKSKQNIFSFKIRMMLFVAALTLGIGMDGKYIYDFSKEQPMLITTMSNKVYLTKVLGNINFHILDINNFVMKEINSMKPVPNERKEEIKSYFSNNSNNQGNNLSGAGSGKNLIMIQVEALQQFVINAKVNGEEVTPNLNRWMNRSLYFDNFFYQVAAGNTSDAEFMSNNSLYPAASGAAYYMYSDDKLNSLPKLMAEKGYETAAFHGYEDGFWNRNVMYKTEGFNNFYGETSFNVNEEVGLGLSDKSFFNQSLEKLKGIKQPFYSFMVTLSSHYPYEDAKGYGDFDITGYEGTILGDYFKGIHYADEQLGMFLDKLEKEGLMDNSVIVLYGDHNAIPKEYIDQLYKFENIENATDLQWYQLQKVPMFVHFPKDQYKGVNHTYSGQMDLSPTIANIFNLDNKYMFGKDIINSSDQKVVFRNGSFTDGKVFYVSWTNSYYDIATGRPIAETPELKKKKESVLNELSYSDDILNGNLLKSFDK
jgi:phosphoglycerol transferase MdoB-like AlkP superfamily enzyme